MPIKSEARASLAVTGTLAILRPPLVKKPPYLFWSTYVPSMAELHNKYASTLDI